jgi:hypothetical protein
MGEFVSSGLMRGNLPFFAVKSGRYFFRVFYHRSDALGRSRRKIFEFHGLIPQYFAASALVT